MKITNIKRIIIEDFPKEQQETVQKLGFIINNVFEQLGQIFTKGIEFENLNRSIQTITVENDTTGKLKNLTNLRYTLRGKCLGINVVSLTAPDNPGILPTSAVFVMWSQDIPGLINIKKVFGLPADIKFNVNLEVIGS